MPVITLMNNSDLNTEEATAKGTVNKVGTFNKAPIIAIALSISKLIFFIRMFQ